MSLSYCADHLTDGAIPGAWAKAQGKPAEIRKLIEVNLWVADGANFRIPDYLKHNLSKARVEERSDRGKELADARWAKRDAMRSALPNAEHDAVLSAVQNRGSVQCPSPEPLPLPSPEKENVKTFEGINPDEDNRDHDKRRAMEALLAVLPDATRPRGTSSPAWLADCPSLRSMRLGTRWWRTSRDSRPGTR